MNRVLHRFGLGLLVASLAIVVPGAAAPSAAASGVVMYVDSEPGDVLGQGLQRVYAMGGISAYGESEVFGSGINSGEDFWDVRFTAPVGQVLTPGTTYVGVTGEATAGHGAIQVTGGPSSGNCFAGSESWFTVHEFTIPEMGPVVFAATFELRCAGAEGSMFGYFGDPEAMTDVVALIASATSITFPETLLGSATSMDVTVESAGSAPATIANVGLTGTGIDNVSITDQDCTTAALDPGTSCTVTLSFQPVISGNIRASLVIDDDTVRGSRTSALAGLGVAPTSTVTWGKVQATKPDYSWSWHAGLTRTQTPGVGSYLHSVATTDRVGGAWADDNGPYLGVMYSRGNASGSEWTTPKRLNPAAQHGDHAVITSWGQHIYVAWVQNRKYIGYNGAAPRTLYFRRNTNLGAGGAWRPTLRLTSIDGRVDLPAIAASGSFVYVIWTDSDTGKVRLARSKDRGVTWTKTTVGTTTRSTADGFVGLPSIAAAGTNVAVAWLSNADRDIVARVSANSGATFSAATKLAEDADSEPTLAAKGSLLALAWTAGDGARVRIGGTSTWSEVHQVGAPSGSGVPAYAEHGSPAVAIGGAGQVGVAWTAYPEWADPGTRSQLVWAESTDWGLHWYRAQVIGALAPARRMNDAAAVVWPSSAKRVVLWNGYSLSEPHYRMYIRSGSGTN